MQLHELGLARKEAKKRAYVVWENLRVNKDAWIVTPRQHRRFHKRLHKLGVIYSGSGMAETVEFRAPHRRAGR